MEVAKQDHKKKLYIANDKSSHYTILCKEKGCAFLVSCKSCTRRDHIEFWSIYERKSFPSCFTHSECCIRNGNIGPKLLSEVLSKQCPEIFCNGSSASKIMEQLRLNHGISLGSYHLDVGQNPNAKVVVYRLTKYISQELHGNDVELIERLPSLMRHFEFLNPGCKTFIEATEDGLLKRCAAVTQRSIWYFKSNYVRKLFSIDCGFWKNAVGKEYKLILILASTGNNTNLTVLWGIVDGETKDNIMWALECLGVADIHTNNSNIAFISDEGLGIVHGLQQGAPLAAKFLCSKHWIGNHKGWGHKDALYWTLITDCRSEEQQHNALNALKDAKENCYQLYIEMDNPEKLFLHPRLLLQSEGTLPATYGRSMSFVEQGMKENVEGRSLHPLESFVAFTALESESFTRESARVSKVHTVLTTYAMKELHQLVLEAQRVRVTPIDTLALLFRTETQNVFRNHLTCWISRSCSDCHCFAETHMPCKHLVAIWVHLNNYNDIVLQCQDENDQWLYTNDYYFAIRHLFGPEYWTSTMQAAHMCYPILPVSLTNVNVLPQDCITLKMPNPKRGRPDKKRKASSMDSFTSGSVTKSRILHGTENDKENIEGNSSALIHSTAVRGKQSTIRLTLQTPSDAPSSSMP
jgi:hypothetical protein